MSETKREIKDSCILQSITGSRQDWTIKLSQTKGGSSRRVAAGAPEMYYKMTSNSRLHFFKIISYHFHSIRPCPLSALSHTILTFVSALLLHFLLTSVCSVSKCSHNPLKYQLKTNTEYLNVGGRCITPSTGRKTCLS